MVLPEICTPPARKTWTPLPFWPVPIGERMSEILFRSTMEPSSPATDRQIFTPLFSIPWMRLSWIVRRESSDQIAFEQSAKPDFATDPLDSAAKMPLPRARRNRQFSTRRLAQDDRRSSACCCSEA